LFLKTPREDCFLKPPENIGAPRETSNGLRPLTEEEKCNIRKEVARKWVERMREYRVSKFTPVNWQDIGTWRPSVTLEKEYDSCTIEIKDIKCIGDKVILVTNNYGVKGGTLVPPTCIETTLSFDEVMTPDGPTYPLKMMFGTIISSSSCD